MLGYVTGQCPIRNEAYRLMNKETGRVYFVYQV